MPRQGSQRALGVRCGAERLIAEAGEWPNWCRTWVKEGERQLALFARALVQETPVLLLDEPSSNLDIRHQDRIFSMAQELARELGADGNAVALLPHRHGTDGFFMAAFRREG